MSEEDWKRWLVPGVIPVSILEIASERGLDPDAILAAADISIPRSELFESGMTFGQHADLLRVVEARLADPCLGFELGWRLPPTALGSVGYAILASGTLADALDLLQRFWHLVGRSSTLTLDTEGEVASLSIDLRVAMGPAEEAFVKEVTLVSMVRGALALVPDAAALMELWFDFPEPPQGAYVRERLGSDVRYAMAATQLRFPASFLARRLAMSNPVGLRAAVKWCEREEQMRGLADSRVTARVQSDLQSGPDGYPTLEQTARKLAMAPRTLRRHLEQEGTRFSDLLETARRRDALRLLDNPDLAVHEVAALLGYVDAANFTRAFRRWTEQTPTQYRRRPR